MTQRKRIGLLVGMLAGAGFLLSPPAAAQEGGEAQPLRVLTKTAPPFVIESEAGDLTGMSIELWDRVAARIGVSYELEAMPLEEMLEAVSAGEADAAVAAITITAEREGRMDFSHPYYTSGLGILVPREQGALSNLGAILANLVSPAFLKTVTALAAVLLVSGLLMWVFERKRNAEQFGQGVKGVGSGFWWSAVTMTTVGYGDKAPVTLGGRIVALIWMFTSVIVIAAFTGGIASAVTVGALSGKVAGPEDLDRARVAAVADTTASAALDRMGIAGRRVATLDDAIGLLNDGRVDAVVHDAPILRYLVNEERAGESRVLDATFEPQQYGVALPPGSELREEVNQAILAELKEQAWRDTVRRYLGN